MTPKLDQLVALFNARSLDLPEGLFDRKTQFLLNGTSFEELLGRSPDDPLVLMLARGPAGYRFALKALQHAVPDVTIERGEVRFDVPSTVAVDLWLSGHLRGTGRPVDTVVAVAARLSPAGSVEAAEATVDAQTLEDLRAARLSV